MPDLTKTFLEQRYVVEQKNSVDIGVEVGVSPQTVRKALRQCGIPVRSRQDAMLLCKAHDVDSDDLAERYKEGASPQALAEHFGTTRRRILGQLKRLGVYEEARTYKGDRHWHTGVTLAPDHVQKILASRIRNGSHTGPDAVPVQERFWQYVERGEGCWRWTGNVNNMGYGMIYDAARRRKILAHRVSWEIHYGEIPERRVLLHQCDHPWCVNPAHLALGTQADNMQDMAKKFRGNRSVFVDAKSILNVIELAKDGCGVDSLAERFGVSVSTIYNILRGRTHGHVGDAEVKRARDGLVVDILPDDVARKHVLLDEEVQYIRTSMASGAHSAAELAKIFCVSPMTVYNVANRRTHARVPGEVIDGQGPRPTAEARRSGDGGRGDGFRPHVDGPE